jgi:hypothetical protein
MGQALAMLLGAAATAAAQDTISSRELDPLARLDQATRYAVEVILDSARLASLPTRPIESKALEGISKRANGRVIVLRVREVFRSLRDARSALGRTVSTDELEAGAGALRVGVPASDLAQLARTRRDKQLTVPLVVLADLINRGVPRETATQTIAQLVQKGAADDDFQGLWQGVQRDIVSGTDPGVALLNRAREVPVRTSPAAPVGNRPPEPSENQNR